MKIYSKFTNINSTKEVIVLIAFFSISIIPSVLLFLKTKQLEHIKTPYLDQYNRKFQERVWMYMIFFFKHAVHIGNWGKR